MYIFNDLLIYYYKYSNLYFCKKKRAKQNKQQQFYPKKFKINLNCFFTLKSKKEGASFCKSLWTSGWKFHRPLCLVSSCLFWPSSWFDLLLCDASHEVTWKATFFHIFIEYLVLKSTLFPMYNKSVRPFWELLKNWYWLTKLCQTHCALFLAYGSEANKV